MIDLFDELAAVTDVLNENGIKHALVGGLAYCVWVEARNTEDIDLLIQPGDWERVRELLDPSGYRALAMPMDFDNVRIRRLTKFQDRDVVILDFLLAEGDLAAGIDNAVTLAHDSHRFHVAPPDVIILMKSRRMSDKDRSDIRGLKKMMEARES